VLNVTDCKVDVGKSEEFTFQITPKSKPGDAWHLQANSEEEMVEWLQYLGAHSS